MFAHLEVFYNTYSFFLRSKAMQGIQLSQKVPKLGVDSSTSLADIKKRDSPAPSGVWVNLILLCISVLGGGRMDPQWFS